MWMISGLSSIGKISNLDGLEESGSRVVLASALVPVLWFFSLVLASAATLCTLLPNPNTRISVAGFDIFCGASPFVSQDVCPRSTSKLIVC